MFTSLSGYSVVFAVVRPTLLQVEELRMALSRAYSSTAVALMYDGPQGYNLGRSRFDDISFDNKNVTGYRLAYVLVPGVVAPALPATLLIVWALISCYLSIRYGFLRRCTDTLGSVSMFRLGGDLAVEVKIKAMQGYYSKDIRDAEQTKKLPRLVGDTRPGFSPGHINLVIRVPSN
jgi:hypothetical protein